MQPKVKSSYPYISVILDADGQRVHCIVCLLDALLHSIVGAAASEGMNLRTVGEIATAAAILSAHVQFLTEEAIERSMYSLCQTLYEEGYAHKDDIPF